MSERLVTVLFTTKNCGLRANDQIAKMGCRQEKIEECESGCAYHGITDFVTNTLMKVQHVAVSENSVHNHCVPRTVIWTWSFVLSRQNVTESAAWIEVKRTVNIGSVSIADYLVVENLM